MTTVTLDLPPAAWERAQAGAEAAGCTVETYLASRLTEPEDGLEWARHADLAGLSDDQLLVHIHAMVPPAVQERLSRLQHDNNEGKLAPAELDEFDRLIRSAHAGTLLKARALLEWRRRHGSLPPEIEAALARPNERK